MLLFLGFYACFYGLCIVFMLVCYYVFLAFEAIVGSDLAIKRVGYYLYVDKTIITCVEAFLYGVFYNVVICFLCLCCFLA